MADTIMWSRSKQVNTNLVIKLNGGGTEGTNLFTYNGSGAKTINITPSSIGAAASSAVKTYAAGTGLSLSGTTFNHKVSVTAANRGPTANATLGPGGQVSVPYIDHDAQGHVTSSANRTITLNSNILDTGDIVTALGSATSNSKVLGAKLTADNINSLSSKITTIQNKLSAYIMFGDYVSSLYTISGNGTAKAKVTIPMQSGYTRVVWYVSVNNRDDGSGESYGNVYRIYYSDDNTYIVGIRNLSSSTIKIHAIVRCVYVKNSYIKDLGEH